MGAAINLKNGDKYGLFTVLVLKTQQNGRRAWLCRCDCGTEKLVEASRLRTGHTLSCGCEGKRRRAKFASLAATTHGQSKSQQYIAWSLMHDRCRNPNNESYKRYGGRGITVCERWKSYENFIEDMGLRPNGKTLDRINNDGNYEPSNCRWATQKQQMRNMSANRHITAFGMEKTLVEWSEFSGHPRERIANRLRRGWSNERAILTGIEVQIGA